MAASKDPGVLPTLFSSQGISDFVIVVVGTFIGAVLALLVALYILRRQVQADKQLAVDSRLLAATNEVTGALSLWISELCDARLTSDVLIFTVRSSQREIQSASTAAPIVAITRNKEMLVNGGLGEATTEVAKAVEMIATARHQALYTINDVTMRIVSGRNGGWVLDLSALLLLLDPVLNDKWSRATGPTFQQLRGHAGRPTFRAPRHMQCDWTGELSTLLVNHGTI